MEEINKIIYDDEEAKLLALENKKKNRKKRMLVIRIISLLGIICLFVAYFASDLSKVKSVQVIGNDYYYDKDIMKLAGIDYETPYLLTGIPFLYEKTLNDNQMIDDCDISFGMDGIVRIEVKEKQVIGYYLNEKKAELYLLLSDGSSLKVEEEHEKSIVKYPLLSGFDDKQLKKIASTFASKKDPVREDIMAMVSEILPHQESYDSDMLKIVMIDGNTFYTSFQTVSQINAYKGVLKELKKENVCFVMIPNTDTIQTEDCSAFE